ncbi:hypothetical protein PGT21_029565 [Puccinia graminis f. sp. tritici]|uniref:Uncharacterized protein n=1 Tax=Puccinia graminis f. sp. tritici TaxID=56615 RepID=A0A5B0MIC2_PUCGR|nr:hypothetical protein PGTUg99_026909 [Puccinia graminis f. sp. tritici]KAA1091251.1 hypothetical protein PGT21_029565 [Puccinia graminis f. sp. tritici]
MIVYDDHGRPNEASDIWVDSESMNFQALTDTVTTGISQWSENLEDGGVLDEELDSADRLVLSTYRLPSR